MPAPTFGDEAPRDYAPFGLVVVVSTNQLAPSMIDVERAGQRWTAPAARDSLSSRPDSVQFFPRGDPRCGSTARTALMSV
jgi:hypothetical protein